MKKSTLLLMAATVFAAGSLLAQGPDLRRDRRPGSPDRPERPERVEKAPRTEMTKEWERVQAELKKKAPEKYAEIEKLQATNLFAAMEKMRELAEKAGIELPLPPRRRGPKGGPGRFGNPMPELRRRFPEKMRELDKIRRSSPVEYRTQIRELMKKMEAEKAEE